MATRKWELGTRNGRIHRRGRRGTRRGPGEFGIRNSERKDSPQRAPRHAERILDTRLEALSLRYNFRVPSSEFRVPSSSFRLSFLACRAAADILKREGTSPPNAPGAPAMHERSPQRAYPRTASSGDSPILLRRRSPILLGRLRDIGTVPGDSRTAAQSPQLFGHVLCGRRLGRIGHGLTRTGRKPERDDQLRRHWHRRTRSGPGRDAGRHERGARRRAVRRGRAAIG